MALTQWNKIDRSTRKPCEFPCSHDFLTILLSHLCTLVFHIQWTNQSSSWNFHFNFLTVFAIFKTVAFFGLYWVHFPCLSLSVSTEANVRISPMYRLVISMPNFLHRHTTTLMADEAKRFPFSNPLRNTAIKLPFSMMWRMTPFIFTLVPPTQRSFEIESSCRSGVCQMSRTPRQDYSGFSRSNQARCDQQSCSLSPREKHCHVFSCSSTSVVDKTGWLASGLQWLLSKQTGSYSNSLK